MTTGQIALAVVGALATVIGAVVAGYFGLRQAAKTAQPNVQSVINAGFTALTERQVQEIERTREALTELQAKVRTHESRINALQARENRFQEVIRRLVKHVHELKVIISEAGRPVPDDPIDQAELAELLDERPANGGRG